MPSWPASLPAPTVGGYTLVSTESVVRTDMDAGPARQRRRFTQTPTRLQLRWLLSAEQFAVFEAWYRWQADEGGAWFTIDLAGGLGIIPHEARFVAQFQARLREGMWWAVSAEIEVRDRPTLSKEALAPAR